MVGSNPESGHPIAAMHIQKAINRGAKLIVIDPIKTEMAQKADVHIQLPPEYNVPVLNSLIYTIIDEKLEDKEFIDKYTNGFDYVKKTVKDYSPEVVAKMTGLDAEDLRRAARIYATNKPAAMTHGMGVTHFNHGVGGVCSVSNLMLVTGNVGVLGSGDYPLRGQQNVQGACDMGVLANVYPNLGKVTDPEQKAYFEKMWNTTGLSDKVGLMKTEIPDAIIDGKVKVFYTLGENPVMSEPNTNHFLKGLSKLEMYIVQDIFLTETSLKADVVLPGVSVAEKTGCYTNAERRVQLNTKCIEPVGEARQDWEILCDLAKRLGGEGFDFDTPELVWEEVRKIDPARYGGMSYYRLKKEYGLNWPCPTEDHPGTPSLYMDKKFWTPDTKANFVPVFFTEDKDKMFQMGEDMSKKLKFKKDYPYFVASPDEKADEEYPLQLITTRKVYQYTVGTMTRRSRMIEQGGDAHGSTAEFNPKTAEKYGLKHGDFILAESRYGKIAIMVEESDTIKEDVVQMSFHYWEAQSNELTSEGVDYTTKTPTYKSAIKVRKISQKEFLDVLEEKREKFQTQKIIFDDMHQH